MCSLTADWVIPQPFSAQAYNRYSYVGNNPINFIDPSGNEAVAGYGGDNGVVITVHDSYPGRPYVYNPNYVHPEVAAARGRTFDTGTTLSFPIPVPVFFLIVPAAELKVYENRTMRGAI